MASSSRSGRGATASPGMRFILMTTPGSPIDASVAESVGIVERISKPFSPPELLACVQRALAGPVAAPSPGGAASDAGRAARCRSCWPRTTR